jgi:hypothetical protein
MADWAKIDVGFLRHPQVVQLKPTEQLGFLAVILYCQEYETDGFIPDAALRTCGIKEAEAKAMQKAGLVTRQAGGWLVDGFSRKQASRDYLERKRAEARARRERRSATA